MNSTTHITPMYMDANATTPPHPEVIDAMVQAMRLHWANPSSPHAFGQASRDALKQARAHVARLVGCKPSEVVFTSGATEANHLALHGSLHPSRPARWLLSQAEHAGVQKLARRLAGTQAAQPAVQVEWIRIRSDGGLDMHHLAQMLAAQPHGAAHSLLVSVMAANNETGVCMPTRDIAALTHACGGLLHVDATQWVGKMPFHFEHSGADLVTLSAHKFGGPKGVGALIVRQGLNLVPMMPGSQERGRRGGTENLPAVVGMASAAVRHTLNDVQWATRVQAMAAVRDAMEQGLCAALPGTVVFGLGQPRLPNTCYLRFGMLHADLVLQRLAQAGVMAASGAACASAGMEPSAVLLAMGVPRSAALCAVRLSLLPDATLKQIDEFLTRVVPVLSPLLSESPSMANDTPQLTGACA